MRILVEQLWKDGLQVDARERSLSAESLAGHLSIETRDGERFATLLKQEHFESPREELLPRLWSPTLVEIKGDRLKLRGVQLNGGRLCHQEWECRVLRQRR